MSLDTAITKLSSKLINKFGTTFQFTSVGEGVYNPSTSETVNTDLAPVTMKGLVEEYAESLRFLGDKLQVGTAIIQGDKKLTSAASDYIVAPKVGDQVFVLNTNYLVNGVANQMASEAIALYVLHLRKQ
jgi:hypothetical protein